MSRRSPGGDDTAPFVEAYRVLRSNLMATLSGGTAGRAPRVIVTSPSVDEGKSAISVNLALSLAQDGQRVALVDLDLRHPTTHQLVGVDNRFGVSDVLLGRRKLNDCLQRIELGGLGGLGGPGAQSTQQILFLGAGANVPNPTELLGEALMAQLLDDLDQQADVVLIDAPPVLPVADMLVIGRMVTGVLLVVEARRTTVTDIARTKDLLGRNQARILGAVLNNFHQRDADYASSYGYGAPFRAGSSPGSAAAAAVAGNGDKPAGSLTQPPAGRS